MGRFASLLLLLFAGCTTITADGPSQTKTFIGMVRVKVPDRKGDLTAVEVKALGAGWDDGPFIGWKSGNWVTADPSRCQLLIIIRSPAQAENAAKVLQILGEHNACVADFTHSLHH